MNDKMDKEISELLFKNAFEEYENARCDEIIEKYKDTEPEYSEEHKRRMKRLFKKEKKSFCWGKFVKRAAMIILAVFLSGALALQVEAFRIQIENWYYEITGEAIHIGNSIEELPGYAETDMPIYVLSDEFVESFGFSVTQEIEGRIVSTEYININEKYIIVQQFEENNSLHIDYNNENIEKQKIHGKERFVINSGEELILCWEEKNAIIYFYTNLSFEEVTEIIDSFVIK